MRHDLPTTLIYYNEASASDPYAHQGKSFKGTVTDISGNESKYTLDDHGFQLVNHETKVTDFLDEQNVKKNYYPEIEELLKDTYVVFDPSRTITANVSTAPVQVA
jgi:hypothetical protein